MNRSELITRIDYIIGIRKYTGPSSYPINEGFLLGVIWDYLVLLVLLIQKFVLQSIGIWDFMELS